MSQISLLTPELVCTNGVENHFEIDAPWRGVIRTLRIAQVSGIDVAAIVDIHQAKQASTSSSSSGDGLISVQVAELHQVCPTQNVIAGVPEMTFDVEWLYQNIEGEPPGRVVRKLYVSISPGGAGESRWRLSMEIETD